MVVSIPMLLPTVKQHVSSDTVALVGSIAAIFLVTLIIVSIITVKISDVVLDSRIGAVDRSLGFLFGAAWLADLRDRLGVPELAAAGKVPDWAAEARTRPMLDQYGEVLKTQLPRTQTISSRG